MRVLVDAQDQRWLHHWVVMTAERGLSTPEVFAALDDAGGPTGTWPVLVEPGEAELRRLTGGADELAGALVNDLETVAFRLRPELADVARAAREMGALDVVLSGSGPSVAALVATEGAARALADAWSQASDAGDVLITRGPAAGARCESEGTE